MNTLKVPLTGISGAALGVLFLACFFVLCLIAVLGIKSLWIYLCNRFSQKAAVKEPVAPVKKPPRKPVRSIVVDPDEIDRIVVKKSD